ncbi:hypothetical protein T484DRAFT_2600007 [Baffinella frigidus]|nr:hypothetical protein T484DRAFT_2600007 [Cryptophyta sp. CCMP2293]
MEDTEYMHTRRGLREHVYGAVSITATPAALFICTWQEMECTACNKSMDSGDELARCRECKKFFHDACGTFASCPGCLQDAAPRKRGSPGGGADMETESDDDSGMVDDSEVGTSNGSRGGDLERGPALKQELAEYRKFKPHVVFTDRPDNYVAYPAEHWDSGGYATGNIVRWEASLEMPNNGQTIIRRVVDPRKDKCTRKFKFYREEEEEVGLAVRIKAAVDARFQSYKGGEKGAWGTDGVALKTILKDISKDKTSPYRHALIISDNTKMTAQQGVLAKAILDIFYHSPLAIVIWNNKAIEVRFTEELDTKSLQATNEGMGTRAVKEVGRVLSAEDISGNNISCQWNTNDEQVRKAPSWLRG